MRHKPSKDPGQILIAGSHCDSIPNLLLEPGFAEGVEGDREGGREDEGGLAE